MCAEENRRYGCFLFTNKIWADFLLHNQSMYLGIEILDPLPYPIPLLNKALGCTAPLKTRELFDVQDAELQKVGEVGVQLRWMEEIKRPR
jgi:hypothetical protein